MATYTEQLQDVWHRYSDEHGGLPATLREAVEWGVSQGLLTRPTIDPLARLQEDMSRALREEYKTDRRGRRYRANHAVRITKAGVQFTLWAEITTAPREHMLKAFAQRRGQIVGDCLQLKTDVDVYNDAHPEGVPIQTILDFTDDVEELRILAEATRRGAPPSPEEPQPVA